MFRSLSICAVVLGLAKCSTTESGEPPMVSDGDAGIPEAGPPVTPPDAGTTTSRVEGKSGTLFGVAARSFARVTPSGTIASVGVEVPLAALSGGPADHPFADDLVLEMADVAKQQT